MLHLDLIVLSVTFSTRSGLEEPALRGRIGFEELEQLFAQPLHFLGRVVHAIILAKVLLLETEALLPRRCALGPPAPSSARVPLPLLCRDRNSTPLHR